MNRKNTAALVVVAPILYRLYGTTDSGWSMQYGFACMDGWFDILMRLSVDLEEDLREMQKDGMPVEELPVALQVKEKYASLKFYVGNRPSPYWQELIAEAATECERICERCGQPGTLAVHQNWYSTLCPKHHKLNGYVEGDMGEHFVLGTEECPKTRAEERRDRLGLAGILRLAGGDLDCWMSLPGTFRAVVYAIDLPPSLWPAMAKLANEQGQIPLVSVEKYLHANRWLPNVRAALGLPAVQPGEFVEEAESLYWHPDMELVGSVVLPGCKGAAMVFIPHDAPSLKIVPWLTMPAPAAEAFRKWHVLGTQHPLGPYWYDFQAWAGSRS